MPRLHVAAHQSLSRIWQARLSFVLNSGFGGKYRDFDPLGKQAYLDQVALIQDRECIGLEIVATLQNQAISHVQRCRYREFPPSDSTRTDGESSSAGSSSWAPHGCSKPFSCPSCCDEGKGRDNAGYLYSTGAQA